MVAGGKFNEELENERKRCDLLKMFRERERGQKEERDALCQAPEGHVRRAKLQQKMHESGDEKKKMKPGHLEEMSNRAQG